MSDDRGKVAKVLAPNPEYSHVVGAKKATVNVAANAVVSAVPATFIVMVARYNGLNWWPESADPAAATTLMTLLTGVPRYMGDWIRVNITEPRHRATSEPIP